MVADRYYVPGTFYRICDRTGFKTRSYNTKKEWNGLIVRTNVWEIRQPQDFVKGIPDNQAVPQPRPRQPDRWIYPETGGASFEVYGDVPGYQSFLVQNTNAFNLGVNDASPWLNPNGTAEFTAYAGPVQPVSAADFPSNIS